jgi:hypothetical protein
MSLNNIGGMMYRRASSSAILYSTLAAIFLSISMKANAADWQYAGNTGGKDDTATFFDAEGIQHLPSNAVRVWSIGVNQESIDNYFNSDKAKSSKEFKELTEKSGKRLLLDGTPKYLQLKSIKKYYAENYTDKDLNDAAITFTVMEVLANTGRLPIKTRVFYELDCEDKRFAVLAGTSYSPDGSIENSASTDVPKYNYIAPDTVAEWLSQLACQSSTPQK